jgi:hypothetical protein
MTTPAHSNVELSLGPLGRVRRMPAVGRLYALAFAAFGSLGMSIAFAVYRFLQVSVSGSGENTYDAYRYDLYARFLSRATVEQILDADIEGLAKTGYVRVLAIFYHYWGPDALAGCVFNWVLWAASGLLLLPYVSAEKHARDLRAVFLVTWLLLPDAVDWTGTTSKEPLGTFLIALSLWLAQAVKDAGPAATALGGVAVIVLASLGAEVRSALSVLIVLPYAVVLERRYLRSRWVIPWAGVVAVLALSVSFVGLGGILGDRFGRELADVGHTHAASTFQGRFASDSVVARLGSDNRWLDLLAVPVRGLAHIISPLMMSPLALPLAAVAEYCLLPWTSAAVYTLLAVAILLSYRWRRAEGEERSPTDGVLLATSVLALLILGTTGFLHERYRSVVVPALLPLGVRCLDDEWRVHRGGRLVVLAGAALWLGTLAYVGLKFVF